MTKKNFVYKFKLANGDEYSATAPDLDTAEKMLRRDCSVVGVAVIGCEPAQTL